MQRHELKEQRMSERKNVTTTTVRRSLLGVFAGGLLGAAATATLTLPAANAAPDTCSASGVANTITSASQSFSSYLVSHPETDKALTDIAKQPGTVAAGVVPGVLDQQPGRCR